MIMKALGKVFLILFVTALLLLVGTFVGLTAIHHVASAERVHAFLESNWWAFAIWRYVLLGVLIWRWPNLCQWYGKRKSLSKEAVRGLIGLRWWVLGFIVLFEIVVVYGV